MALAGCASPPAEPPLLPVSGVVKIDGQPLGTGVVTFYPDESKGNTSTRLPHGEIDKDGHYTLTTFGKPGAAAGHYKIVIAATLEVLTARPQINPDGSIRQPKWLMHDKYVKPETTDLSIEVVEDSAAGRYDLRLAPP